MLSLGHKLHICNTERPSELTKLLTWCQVCPCLISWIPSEGGIAFPGCRGPQGYYCCHKLKHTAWRFWCPLFRQDLVTSKYYTFVIMTKTRCSSHCAKINQPSQHSWVSDSRGQWVSLGKNCFLFHRLTNMDNISWGHMDSGLFFQCLWIGL